MSTKSTAHHQPEIAEHLLALQKKVNEVIAFYQQDLNFTTMVYALWSAKDILGHLVCWHESFARNLADVSEGRKPNPLKGKLSEVNQLGVEANRLFSIDELIARLNIAQQLIEEHIFNTEVQRIPYKRGTRDYSRPEHLEIVVAHLRRHLKDLHKIYHLRYAET
ncbi:DinB family protein [Tunicatimonas pelagia]|uniref:DinB family protein n=1 Tax=Tunicatimonas pelagia TaxID=931531 RepID=UPI002666E93E|nr:DinB family protein [Tunicatimonas pelagia]WKN41374.1 hypothetical protein P0M28_20270 [Tunicatimonas pelagia]